MEFPSESFASVTTGVKVLLPLILILGYFSGMLLLCGRGILSLITVLFAETTSWTCVSYHKAAMHVPSYPTVSLTKL